MAPLPPEGTPRYRVNYSVNGIEHDFQLRSHLSPAAFGTFVDSFLTAITDALYEIIITTVDFAADNSNIFLPVSTGIEGNAYSTGDPPVGDEPWYYDFIGRSSGGRRWRLAIFGARTLGDDYRIAPGENADLTNGIAVLTPSGSNFVAIDDLPVTVYTYVNAGVNAHWQRAMRP